MGWLCGLRCVVCAKWFVLSGLQLSSWVTGPNAYFCCLIFVACLRGLQGVICVEYGLTHFGGLVSW